MLENYRVFMIDRFSPEVAAIITTLAVVLLIVLFIAVPTVVISGVMIKDLPRNNLGWYGYCRNGGGYWKEDGALTFVGDYTRDMTESEFVKYCEGEQ